MKKKLNVAIRTFNGTEIIDEGQQPVMLNNVCINTLMTDHPGEHLSGEKKMERFNLAKRLHAAVGEVEISSEEITLLKELVPKMYAPLVVGALYEALEG